MATSTSPAKTAVEDSPIWWFYKMVDARNRYDFEGALEAKKHLERLGYFFSYRPKPRAREESDRA